MICPTCQANNPETNNFCGACGARIFSKTSEPVADSPSAYSSISGPSFLGLTDNTATDPNGYLIEDVPRHGHAGWAIFSLVAVAILVTIGILEWRALHAPAPEPVVKTSPAPASPQPAEPAPAATPSPADESQQAKAAQDQKEWGGVSSPESDQPEDERIADRTATEETVTRQTQESNEKKAAATPKEPNEEEEKAEARTVAKPPDPQQNKMLQLGEKYLYGRGVPMNCPQAVVYFKAAATENNAPAMLHLGAIYASGQCVPQNRTTAYSWFRRAQEADPSNPWITKNMDMVLRDMTPRERASLSQ